MPDLASFERDAYPVGAIRAHGPERRSRARGIDVMVLVPMVAAHVVAPREGVISMLAHLNDQVTGTEVYINPAYVVSVRPEPTDPDHVSVLKLRDGEAVKVIGDHRQVADKLARAEATP